MLQRLDFRPPPPRARRTSAATADAPGCAFAPFVGLLLVTLLDLLLFGIVGILFGQLRVFLILLLLELLAFLVLLGDQLVLLLLVLLVSFRIACVGSGRSMGARSLG